MPIPFNSEAVMSVGRQRIPNLLLGEAHIFASLVGGIH